MAGVEEWRIHLGAHKTATTHLQATLEAMAPGLRADGVAFLPLRLVRPVLRDVGSRAPSRWLRGEAALGRGIEARLAALALEGTGAGQACAALSEENLLGPLVDAMRARPYPRLGRRLRPLLGLAQGRPVTLFLSIRRFDRLLPAAYAAALRYRRLSPWVVRRRARIFGRPPPRWGDVLDRIAHALPGLPIRVWRQEDYATGPRPFLEAFLGRTVGEIPALPPPPWTVTPSAEAVAAVEDLIRAGAHRHEPEAWPARVARIYAEAPAAAGTPFRPLGPANRHAEAYALDLAAIRRDRPGCLIEP